MSLSMEEESAEPILSSAIVLDEYNYLKRGRPHLQRYRPYLRRDRPRYVSKPIKADGQLAEFAKKTFRRHEESNLRIDTFRLSLKTESYARFSLATEWTLNALKLGATDLTFTSDHTNIAIPLAEVFGSENDVRLCLHSSQIMQLKVTECPGLKSLTLSRLEITRESFFHIISSCPLIENLSLSEICGSGGGRSDDSSDDDEQKQQQCVISSPPTLFLHKLRSLVLSHISSQFQIQTLFLDDLSSKFPNLKDLTLGVAKSLHPTFELIQNISSASLETLNIIDEDIDMVNPKQLRVPRIELDVPSVRKFIVSFRSISGYLLESHVSLNNSDWIMGTAWFHELSKFLTKLRGSKIHLCLHLQSYSSSNYDVRDLDGLNVCEVEDLTLDIKDISSLTCHALLDGLFRICRPKMITQYVIPPGHNEDRGNTRNNNLFICRTLERAMQARSSLISTQFMYGMRDLEELVGQQLFDEVWQPQPLSSILDDSSTSGQIKRRFRLQLKWKPSLCINEHTRPCDDDHGDAKRFKSVI